MWYNFLGVTEELNKHSFVISTQTGMFCIKVTFFVDVSYFNKFITNWYTIEPLLL
jgi:hypothetical protein